MHTMHGAASGRVYPTQCVLNNELINSAQDKYSFYFFREYKTRGEAP